VSEIGSALRIGRRVVVTGMAGAGKSTFARQLSAKTGLPVIHLDVHFWKPGWVEPSDQEWRDVQSKLLAGEEWIADGNYSARKLIYSVLQSRPGPGMLLQIHAIEILTSTLSAQAYFSFPPGRDFRERRSERRL